MAFAQVIPPECTQLIITSKKGQVVKLELKSIPKLSRDTQGVFLMRFSKAADSVTSATSIEEQGRKFFKSIWNHGLKMSL